MKSLIRPGLPYFFVFYMIGIGIVMAHYSWVMLLISLSIATYLFWVNKKMAVMCAAIAGAAMGYCLIVVPHHSSIPSSAQVLYGHITSDPRFNGDIVSFSFQTQYKEHLIVRRRFETFQEKKAALKALKVSQSCIVHGKLSAPDPPSNFHDFSYKQWLFYQRIFYSMDSSQPIRCVHQYQPSILDSFRQIRADQSQKLSAAFTGTGASMMKALIFGDRTGMNPSLLQSYQSLGLLHLLSVSGLHINFLFGSLYFLFIRFGLTKERAALLICCVIPFYMILAGEAPSIFRSGLMMLFFLGSRLFPRQRVTGWEALSLSGIIILIINPLALMQLGFQLSYLVTFSLLLSAHYFKKFTLSESQKIIMISLIAQVVTLPILLKNFYDISLLTPIANLLFIPFITLIILPFSFLIYFLSFLSSPICVFLFGIYQWLLDISGSILNIMSHVSFAKLRYGSEPDLFLILLAIGVLFALLFWEKLKPAAAILLLLSLLIIPFLAVSLINVVNPYGHVIIFDVGQGDSSFIELPHHQMSMLIDTGGTMPIKEAAWKKQKNPYDVGVKVVYHELQAMGVKKINYLVLTHRDYDHIGGAEGLLNHMKVDYIIINDHFIVENREKRLFKLAHKKGTKIIVVHKNQSIHVNHYTFHFLSVNTVHPTSNNGSLVMSTKIGGVSWLFTGDLEKEGEQNLLAQIPDISTDILKVGHHGSKTSTSENWLKKLHPKLALISVGKHNHYGHPSPEVIERLKKDHIPFIRTDQHGEIKFTFKGTHLFQLKTAKK